VIKGLVSSVHSSAKHQLVRDTTSLTVGQSLRLVLQAVYFITIARSLGPQQYGAFVAMAAMVAIVVPFAGVGSSSILMKNVSKDRGLLSVYWGNGLLLILLTGFLLVCLVLTFGPLFVGHSLTPALLLIAVSDLVLARVVDLAGFACGAIGQMGETAKLNVYLSLARLCGLLLLVATVTRPNVEEWSVAYIAGSIACSSYAVARVTSIAGVRFSPKRLREEITEGGYFAIGGSATTIYNDIDKTMLARLSDFASTGIYGAAYRLIDVSMAPIGSMTSAAYPEFFRRGHHGIKLAEDYAWKLIKRAALYGSVVFVCLFFGASILPYILGGSFQSCVAATRWLAIIPLLRCVHLFLGNTLAGSGYQGTRAAVQVGIGLLNIGLNFYFIARWGWLGAAWTSVMCDSLLLIALWAALKWTCRNAERTDLAGIAWEVPKS
jgi:O-antigen/teichoic acid export membrane protein